MPRSGGSCRFGSAGILLDCLFAGTQTVAAEDFLTCADSDIRLVG